MTETNRYKDQHFRTVRLHANLNEVRVFLTLKILPSMVKGLNIHIIGPRILYSQHQLFHNVGWQKIEVIKQYLRFSNYETFDENTHPVPKLNKIWSVYHNLAIKFDNLCTPEQKVTIDESILMCKMRLG